MSQLTFGAALPPNPPTGAKQQAKQSKVRKLKGLTGDIDKAASPSSPVVGSGVLAEFGASSGAFTEQKKAPTQKGAEKAKKSTVPASSRRAQPAVGADGLSIGFTASEAQKEEMSPSSPSGTGSVKRERTSILTAAGSVSIAFPEAKGAKADEAGAQDSEHLGSTVDGRFLLPKGEQKKVLHFQEQETIISDDLLKAQSKDPDKTSLCVRMLMDGYVNSFVDFFYLTHRNDVRKGADGENEKKPDSNNKVGSLFDITGGESYGPEPLANIKENLCSAEAAQRKGDSAQVFDSFGHLADFFQQAGDTKTALYFYQKCVETAEQLGDINRQASATLSLGLAHDGLGDEMSAFEVLEKHLALCRQLHEPTAIHTAQEHLLDVYRRHAENLEGKADYRSAVEFHKRCLELAVKLKDTRGEGVALYRLGMSCRQLGEPKQALEYQQQYLEICQRSGDQTGEGSACAALAQCCQDLGDNATAVKHLDNFLDISTRSADSVGQAEACSGLGAIYTCQGNYKKAVGFYEKAFEIAKSIGDRKLIESTRINVGIASGNLSLGGFMETVHKDLSALLKWKTRRVPIPRK